LVWVMFGNKQPFVLFWSSWRTLDVMDYVYMFGNMFGKKFRWWRSYVEDKKGRKTQERS
jgi:hypothetical protein